MRIGYPCINRSIGCTANSTFRLKSYSEGRLFDTVANNLACLERILQENAQNGLLFFRVSSDIVPFASHEVCRADWVGAFRKDLARIGRLVRREGMRLSMHPDQFVLINALDPDIVRRSVAELEYHAELLDLMQLNRSAKVQIHVGGMYGDRERAMDRFVLEYRRLTPRVRKRLVIENDDRLFPLADCMDIYTRTGVPVVCDVFHHEVLNRSESTPEALAAAAATWKKTDGPAMVDYSSQASGRRPGAHTESIAESHFRRFVRLADGAHMDLMLEIKDKEKSALKALRLVDRTVL